MAERGGFGPPIEPNKIKGSVGVWTQELTHATVLPPEVCEIRDAWKTLPEHIRLSILALVRSVKGGVL